MDLDRFPRPGKRHAAIAAIVLLLVTSVAFAATVEWELSSGATLAVEDGNGDVTGPEVNFDDWATLTSDEPFPGNKTVDLGPVSFQSEDASSVTVSDSDISGDETTVRDIDTGNETLYVDRGDQRIGLDGGITQVTFSAVDLSSTDTEVSVDGSGTIHVHGFEPNTAYRVEGTTTTIETTDSDGVLTMSASDDDLTFTEVSAPQLSNANPRGDVSSTPVELSVDVDHPDFDAGETVTVNISHGGSQLHSETISSAETVSATVPDEEVPPGGENWSVTATDSNGNTSSLTASYGFPNILEIRDETNPGELIDEDVNLRIQFIGQEDANVYERTATDGTVDMEGLPVDEEFVVTVADDNDNYTSQRILIESVIRQQTVYLLPADESTANIRFVLQDDTGRFGADETRLFVEKPITRDNVTQFRTVAGDHFDASGEVRLTLQDDQRFRLRVKNDEGETRTLGDYQTSGDAVTPLPIGTVEFTGDIDGGAAVEASLREAPEGADHTHEVRFFYIDEEGKTDEFTVGIVDGQGNEVRPETVEPGPHGRFIETYPVTMNPDNDTLYVQVEAQRDGETITFERALGDLPNVAEGWEIDDTILELIAWVSLIALMGLIVITNATIAAIVGVIYATLLVAIGILPIPGVALAAAGAAAILYRLGGDAP